MRSCRRIAWLLRQAVAFCFHYRFRCDDERAALGVTPQVVRDVDFDRQRVDGLPGVVQRLEADPGRSGWLALVKYSPGAWGLVDTRYQPRLGHGIQW